MQVQETMGKALFVSFVLVAIAYTPDPASNWPGITVAGASVLLVLFGNRFFGK
ncbi:hypothetical protein J7443_24115 [Tropicibacter sp. R15_0]|uniref:hypothetical protein n=1 Tax=Tropicibacter sp. R15_0 TaxID=2821101 RepID=UPI001ADC011A|nr:hypothetical protein [Tropicibacter sp. R15_0]MBO9468333.1 hypothetical protein [Tropicibacter sp. R15_0]